MEGAIVFYAVLMSVFAFNAGYIDALPLTYPLNTGWDYQVNMNKRRLKTQSKNGILNIHIPIPPTMPPTMPPTIPPTMPPTMPPILSATSLDEINPNLFSPLHLKQDISVRNVGQTLQRIWSGIKNTLRARFTTRDNTKWRLITPSTPPPRKLFFNYEYIREFPEKLESTGKPVIIPVLMPPKYRLRNNRISITDMDEIIVNNVDY